jgi:hypothetical protein
MFEFLNAKLAAATTLKKSTAVSFLIHLLMNTMYESIDMQTQHFILDSMIGELKVPI